MTKNPYIVLAECLLPEDMVEYFDVVKVEKTSDTLDVTLEAMKQANFVPMVSMRKVPFVTTR